MNIPRSPANFSGRTRSVPTATAAAGKPLGSVNGTAGSRCRAAAAARVVARQKLLSPLPGLGACRWWHRQDRAAHLAGPGACYRTSINWRTRASAFPRCLIVSLEDDADELRRRILAARLHYNIPLSELDGWLFPAAPGGKVGKLKAMNAKGQIVDGELKAHLEKSIEANAIDCVIIDPLVKTHSVEENNNSAIDGVAQLLTDLACQIQHSDRCPASHLQGL